MARKSKAVVATDIALPAPWLQIPQGAMIRSQLKNGNQVNAFAWPTVAPGVLPRGKTQQKIAMDNGGVPIEVNAWAAQQVYNGAFFNGIGFMGYTLLSEMAQRPEYRRISEVLAVEMTRKWIRIKTVSNDDTAQAAKAERIQQLTDHAPVL
jgi:hypothetical protein